MSKPHFKVTNLFMKYKNRLKICIIKFNRTKFRPRDSLIFSELFLDFLRFWMDCFCIRAKASGIDSFHMLRHSGIKRLNEFEFSNDFISWLYCWPAEMHTINTEDDLYRLGAQFLCHNSTLGQWRGKRNQEMTICQPISGRQSRTYYNLPSWLSNQADRWSCRRYDRSSADNRTVC